MREHPLAALWPPARIQVVTPRLELRLPTDDELYALADVAAAGVHDAADMPFAAPWSDAPVDELARGFMAWHWTARGAFTTASWTLELGVFLDGEPVGCQAVLASNFAIKRVFGSGSWLGRAHHGRGIGTEMRQAMLELGFGSFGAQVAHSDAYEDNPSSIRVSEKCGYLPNGDDVHVRRRGVRAPGGPAVARAMTKRFALDHARWEATRRTDIEVQGVDNDLLRLVGAIESTV